MNNIEKWQTRKQNTLNPIFRTLQEQETGWTGWAQLRRSSHQKRLEMSANHDVQMKFSARPSVAVSDSSIYRSTHSEAWKTRAEAHSAPAIQARKLMKHMNDEEMVKSKDTGNVQIPKTWRTFGQKHVLHRFSHQSTQKVREPKWLRSPTSQVEKKRGNQQARGGRERMAKANAKRPGKQISTNLTRREGSW